MRQASREKKQAISEKDCGTTVVNGVHANGLKGKELEVIVLMDSTFGTWVQSVTSPYNRSKPADFELCFHKGYGGSCFGISELRAGAGVWQLPECVYLSLAARFVCGASALSLPQMPKTYSFL